MAEGIIIAGFATCGKSVLGKKYSNVIDLESSSYKHNNTNIKNVPIEAIMMDIQMRLNGKS